jgi:hypothetical protein
MDTDIDTTGVLGDDWHPLYSDPIWYSTDAPCVCGATWQPAPEFGQGAREMTHTEACRYMVWANADEQYCDPEWELADEDTDAYLAYTAACINESCDFHTPHMWRVHGRPTGPLG